MLPQIGSPTASSQRALRWIGRCALMGYLLAALGLANPLTWFPAGAGKDLSRPFPCMHGACGCGNADQCWKSCCCHTLEERLAWARRHRVRPPQYVLNRLPTAERQLLGRIDCGNGPTAVAAGEPQTRDCCAPREADLETAKSPAGITLLRPQQCRGVDQDWQGLPVSIPTLAFTWSGAVLPGDWLFADSVAADSVAHQPPAPPPQADARLVRTS